MSIDRIKHGQTFTLSGTLGATNTLIALTGDPGAQINVSGNAASEGAILLYGANLPHKQGATLSDTGVFTNAGAITVGGGTHSTHSALLQIAGTLTNTGLITGQAGNYGAGSRILIGGSGELKNSGTLILMAGSAQGANSGSYGAMLSDTGLLLNKASGVIDLKGVVGTNLSGQYFDGSGGSIAIAGTFTNSGTVNLYDGFLARAANAATTLSVSGVMQNSGGVLVGDTAGAEFYSDHGALLSISGSLSNTGSIAVTGGPSGLFGSVGVRATVTVSGTLTNQGQIDLRSGGIGGHSTYRGQGGVLLDTGTVSNSGTLLVQGYSGGGVYGAHAITGGSIVVNGVLTNTGSIIEQQNAGIFAIGTVTNNAYITAEGGTSFRYIQSYTGYGGYISVVGSFSNGGTITLDGGLGQSYVNYDLPPGTGHGAAINVTGTLNNTGLLVADGGGGGYQTAFGLSFGTGATIAIEENSTRSSVLTNTGTIEIQQGSLSPEGLYGTGAVLVDKSDLTNRNGIITIGRGVGTANAELQIAPGAYLTNMGTIDGGGLLLNQGFLSLGGAIGGVTLTNDGTIGVNAAFFAAINSAVTADSNDLGKIVLYGFSKLQFSNAVAASQTVIFEGTENHLNFGDLTAFAGTLSGLAPTDILDFLKTDVTTATTSGSTLSLTLSTGPTIALALASPLAGVTFTLQSDGHGGTELLFGPGGT